MLQQAVIGYSGTLGQWVSSHLSHSVGYNRANIAEFAQKTWDCVFVCAPSGSRRRAMACPDQDRQDIDSIIQHLDSASCGRVVLISTIDAVVYADSVYGHNRACLEDFVHKRFQHCQTMRLAGLIHSSIQKNILYDLKHNLHIEHINLNSVTQWSPLDRVVPYLHRTDYRDINLVSEPIVVRDIVQLFKPHMADRCHISPVQQQHYDVRPYLFDRQTVLNHMGSYLS